jgi:plasmid stabilization system protein ParE
VGNFQVTPRAQEDLAEASEWYESQRKNLGDDFISEFVKTSEKLSLNPRRYRIDDPKSGGRKFQLSRFPYVVVFTAEENGGMVVHAVVHIKRHDRVWKRRLK